MEAHLGPVDLATLPKAIEEQTEEEKRISKARKSLPPPESALSLHDIEVRLFLNSFLPMNHSRLNHEPSP